METDDRVTQEVENKETRMFKFQNGTHKIYGFMVIHFPNLVNKAMIQETVMKTMNMKVQICSYGSTSILKTNQTRCPLPVMYPFQGLLFFAIQLSFQLSSNFILSD